MIIQKHPFKFGIINNFFDNILKEWLREYGRLLFPNQSTSPWTKKDIIGCNKENKEFKKSFFTNVKMVIVILTPQGLSWFQGNEDSKRVVTLQALSDEYGLAND